MSSDFGVPQSAFRSISRNRAAMSSGIGAASGPTFRWVNGAQSGAGNNNTGIEDREWIVRALQVAEQRQDLWAVQPLEQPRPETSVAVLATGRAPEPQHEAVNVVVDPGERVAPSPDCGVGERVHVDVTVARMAEDRDGDVPLLRRGAHAAHVGAQLLERHATVFHHLERAAGERESREDGGCQAPDLPQGIEPRPIHRGRDVHRVSLETADGVAHHTAGRGARFALELDEQQGA